MTDKQISRDRVSLAPKPIKADEFERTLQPFPLQWLIRTEFPTSEEAGLRKFPENSVFNNKATTGIVTRKETNRLINRFNAPPDKCFEEN